MPKEGYKSIQIYPNKSPRDRIRTATNLAEPIGTKVPICLENNRIPYLKGDIESPR